MINELLLVAENLVVGNVTPQVDGETAVHVFTVIGDLLSDDLSEDEVRSYEMPGGTVFQVMAPSSDRVASGFVLGPFNIPPLGGVRDQNLSVQVISWAKNVFSLHDVSNGMVTINVRRKKENVPLMNLAPPLQFFLGASERMIYSEKDVFDRTCVFWNESSKNWSGQGLQVVRANLTQAGFSIVLERGLVKCVHEFQSMFRSRMLFVGSVFDVGVGREGKAERCT